MRLTLRTLVALVLTGVHIQDAIGQTTPTSTKNPPSNIASSTATISTSAISPPSPPTALPTLPGGGPSSGSPDAVGAMAYASDGKSLFIYGGQHKDSNSNNPVSSNQFFSLDLTQPWSTSSPIWRRLTPPSKVATDPAGVLVTVDHQFLVMGGDQDRGLAYVFNSQNGAWEDRLKEDLPLKAAGPVIASSQAGVFILGNDNTLHTYNAQLDSLKPPLNFAVSPSALSWSTLRSGLLMTYNTVGGLAVGMYKPDDNTAQPATLGSPGTINRTGHCFAPRFTNEDRSANATVLLYDIDGKQWISDFTPSSSGENSGLKPGVAQPTGDPNAKDGSNLASILGGVVGGLAVVALVAGFLIFRRRKARNMKPSVQVLPRSVPNPSNGKNPGGQVNVPMDEYTTIPSPFASDDTIPPLYAAPPLQPISASLMSHSKPGSVISQQMQPYSASFQAPPIPVRPATGSPTAPKIQSPFEVETESSASHPLLPMSSGVPMSGSLGGFIPGSHYSHSHAQGESEGRTGGAFSPTMEAATTVDLIPIEASEAGDGDNEPEQEQVVVSSRGLPSAPERAKSRSHGSGGKTLLEDDADGRRDSTETLDYLEIS
ncbi:hypothetical protein BGZ95_005614 [Linnemannia exigua]|uniref:Galactose oxidase n=1 Tax=Linnemannia exigua TaxID=604196 RepID=A0AAD4DMZ2_9FUNG|nr:hypothetical protein BGZ95_005614 [Linnemannia exigua]